MKLYIAFSGFFFITFFGARFGVPVAFDSHREADLASPEWLGELLFNEPILSLDSGISCASCHRPEFAFADTVAFSRGFNGQLTRRNTPSSMNMLMRRHFMWDGRASTLEEQALLPLEHPGEMNLPRDSAVARLAANAFYADAFHQVYGEAVNLENMLNAMARFQQSLETGDTANDRWLFGDEQAMREDQIRGRAVFFNEGNCIDCHFTPDFTGDEFINIGLFNGKELNDAGRFEITGDSTHLGAFKVPGLRNVAVTAPYMHNGIFATLEEVIAFYNDPSSFTQRAIQPDPRIVPLGLAAKQKSDLKAFLEALTDERYLHLLH